MIGTMAIPELTSITSFNALQRTLETDKDVFRWFLYLISQPAVRSQISENQNTQKDYYLLKKTLFRLNTITLASLILLVFITCTQRYILLLLSCIAIPLYIIMTSKYKKHAIRITSTLVSRDFEPCGFSHQTLYQIGEFYAKKYNVSSLVKMITSVNSVTRKVILYTWALGTFIIPLNFLRFWILILLTYFLSHVLTNTSFIYHRLK